MFVRFIRDLETLRCYTMIPCFTEHIRIVWTVWSDECCIGENMGAVLSALYCSIILLAHWDTRTHTHGVRVLILFTDIHRDPLSDQLSLLVL